MDARASLVFKHKVHGNVATDWMQTDLAFFADDLRSQGVEVVLVDWKPPAGEDQEMLKLLEKLGL